jgi:glycosyltransferase involved in cell wall biosynthesis
LLLSAALIVKNEEKYLAACLSSLQGCVDEIVVVDTGSTDSSREIAETHGARVFEFPWTGDFSEARNYGLARARGEWIFYIDADEELRPGAAPELRRRLEDPLVAGFQVSLNPRIGLTAYRILRLFRNLPEVRFRGLIHENIWPALLDHVRDSGQRVGNLDEVYLDHRGYEGDQEHKHTRNLPLLEEAVRRDPSHVYSWCHLADIQLARGDAEAAEKSWATALSIVRSRTHRANDDALPYLGLLRLHSAQKQEYSELLREALFRFPANVQVTWLHGRAEMEAGKFAAAIPIFERLVEWGESGNYDRNLAYDEKLFGLLPYESLATCHFRLGNYCVSRRYYELAAAADPSRLEFRVKRDLCSSRLEGAALVRSM